ncbi:DUF2303 family protein [Streptomyces sp. MI02-7b]|uniref:DUF2303 family protein n=1 Tax=Streptomyces sp. MI02-7b TaxID=462941 RepID=UPI0029B11488|nr:DUF2303 family protein [Streptomyces sp. MI02-7b]MDX3074593.1 DUF2303 family protein [Streptomyces sp. MI02-7b]
MPNYTDLQPISSTAGDGVQAIIDTAHRAAEPTKVEPGEIYLVATATGDVRTIDLTGDQYLDTPSRKVGTTTVRDAGSFLAYYDKHHDDSSEVYSDVEKLSVTAVLDAHSDDAAAWQQHRLILSLRQTKPWREWLALDGQLVDQDRFASFLEDHLPDLVAPDSATMLEIAQSIQATTSASFQSSSRLQSGERKLVYTEDTTAKAGGNGELTIPEVFQIAVMPFEGAERYRIQARLKYRIGRDGLRLGFKLEQPEDRLAAAFQDVVKQVSDSITEPVINGTPA